MHNYSKKNNCFEINHFFLYQRNNFYFILFQKGEIQKQLETSKAKAIIGTPKTFATIKEAVENCKKDIKIICIKTEANETIPSGAIDFNELIDIKSE